jgi:hypothetical protein
MLAKHRCVLARGAPCGVPWSGSSSTVLDYQGIEAGHVLLRLDPPQNQDVLDG